MSDQLRESPFREIGEGRPWEYREMPEPGEAPVMPGGASLVTLLGVGMLAVGAAAAPFALRLLPAFLALAAASRAVDVLRDVFFQALLYCLLALAPTALGTVMGFGLLRRRAWARVGALLTLPVALVAGGWLVGVNGWAQAYAPGGHALSFSDPAVLRPLGWYAAIMAPLAVLITFGLLQPRVAAELHEEG